MLLISKIKKAIKSQSNSSFPIVAFFCKTILILFRTARMASEKMQLIYESFLTKIIARYCFLPYLPLSKWMQRNDVWIVANIANGVGHVTVEFDNFFHMLASGEIPQSRRYVVILKGTEVYQTFVKLYGHRFTYASAKTWLYNLLLPLLLRYEQRIDVGVSRMKWQLPPSGKLEKHFFFRFPFVYQLNLQPAVEQMRRYYLRRLHAPSLFPLLDGLQQTTWLQAEKLREALRLDPGKKICLIQLKSGVVNATAEATDPLTYLPTLDYLQKAHYQFVFCGREKFPNELNQFKITNYAQSNYASFYNDVLLFNICDLAMVGGSGLSFLADCYNKPVLYLNTWHLAMSLCAKRCVCVPTLMNQKDNKAVSFADQIKIYASTETVGEVFPAENFQVRNASADEILEGMKELISLAKNPIALEPLQIQFNQLDEGLGLISATQSRVSHYFLKKHSNRF